MYYLHTVYPQWEFVPDVTGLSLKESAKKEEDKCVLQTGNSNYYLRPNPIEKDYYYIKDSVIEAFMDPRNLMYEQFMFQFLDLEASKEIANEAAMKKIVGSGNLSNYLNEVMEAARINNINPLHILARSTLEGANKATYSGVTGLYTTNSGHLSHQGYSLDGYYNFFNVGSYATSTYPYTVQRGLAYAAGFLEEDKCIVMDENNVPHYSAEICGELSYQRPWDSQAKAISGGSEVLANGYIRKGQNTLYYEKFNVSSYRTYNVYTHQYMTNVYSPINEGGTLYSAYKAGDLLNSPFRFIIPVYTDLVDKEEEAATPIDKNGDATLKEIKINGELVTGFDKDVVEYPYSIKTNEEKFQVTATPNYPLTKVEGTGEYTFTDEAATVKIDTTAEDGTQLSYVITVKQIKVADEVKVKDVTDKLNVKIDDDIMYGISPGMTAQELLNSINSAHGTGVLTDSKGNKKTSGDLATGDIITIEGTLENDSFTIVVRGDINGDSKINAVDLLLCKKDIINIKKLNGIYTYASDVNYDSKINAIDLLMIKKQILGLSKL